MSFFARIVAALRKKCRAPTRVELGMTLIEIMVVVAIIGLLMGTVGVYAYGRWKKAQVSRTKADIDGLKTALEQYAMDNQGKCPKDLMELYEQKIIKQKPKDPWGQDYMFKCPGEHDTELGDVWSKGRDKQEGTEDDIKSWEDDTGGER